MAKSFTYNIKVIGLKPHVVIFKILFLRVCVLCDVAVGPNGLDLSKLVRPKQMDWT